MASSENSHLYSLSENIQWPQSVIQPVSTSSTRSCYPSGHFCPLSLRLTPLVLSCVNLSCQNHGDVFINLFQLLRSYTLRQACLGSQMLIKIIITISPNTVLDLHITILAAQLRTVNTWCVSLSKCLSRVCRNGTTRSLQYWENHDWVTKDL